MRWAPLLLLLAGCGTPLVPTTAETYKRTPEAEQKYKEAAARGEVKIGMTRDEVRTAWGTPTRTSRTTYQRKRATCWSYLNKDVYFDDDGYVIGWQSLYG